MGVYRNENITLKILTNSNGRLQLQSTKLINKKKSLLTCGVAETNDTFNIRLKDTLNAEPAVTLFPMKCLRFPILRTILKVLSRS